MNKKGAQVTGGVVLLIVLAAVAAYMFIPAVSDIFKAPAADDEVPAGRCPSSGLTEVTLNTQEALASTATNSLVRYYVYDNGKLVKEGATGSDGAVSFDLQCGVNQRYSMLVYNGTDDTGSYAQVVTIDASGATDTHNLKTYEYGAINIANFGSSIDPSGNASVASGQGKICGVILTFTENESASAFNKPLIVCQSNSTAVTDLSFDGVTRADAKHPTRLAVVSGNKVWTFEYDKLLKSTDAAVKLSGKIQFSASTTPKGTDNMTCNIIDQAMFQTADYKTLSLSEGFVTSAENTETIADIGAPDSDNAALKGVLIFKHSDGYC